MPQKYKTQKICLNCGKGISENWWDNEKFVMIITKRGGRIIEFACFHFECWKSFWSFNLGLRDGGGG